MVMLKCATAQSCAGDELAVDIPQDSPPPSQGRESSGAEVPEAPPASDPHPIMAPASGPTSPRPAPLQQPHPAAGSPAPSASSPPQQVLAARPIMCRQTASSFTLDTATD